MKEYEIANLRNVAIIGSGSVGKTSLAEAMLFDAKSTDRLGSVDEGSSILDFEPEELARKISINSALAFCEWKKHKINLLDTPGYANFVFEALGSLRVVDSVLVVISATDGVKFLTQKVWQYADDRNLPRMVFISKMDQERANFYQSVEEARKFFGSTLVPLQVPLGESDSLRGVVDLISWKAWVYDASGSGECREQEVPSEVEERAQPLRDQLIEAIAEGNDELLEKYLEGTRLSTQELREGLRVGTIERRIVPVLCGSAARNIGIHPLMDSMLECLPSPLEVPPIKGSHPKTSQEETRRPGKEEPLSAFVFKTFADPFAGRLSLFRVYSGTLRSDSSVYNASRGERERVGQVYAILGKQQRAIGAVGPGDFGAMAKLKATMTGNTLAEEKAPIQFEPIRFPEPVLSFAIVPKAKGDEEKISTALARLTEEDPTLKVSRDLQTKEMLVSGMGEVHLEVIVERLRRKFGVEVEMRTPRIPYKETIRSSAKVQGKYKKQTGGRGQYGDTWIEVEPLPRGAGFEFVDKIVGGVIPRQYIPAVEKGIVEAMEGGVLAGYPVVDMKVTLYDGSYHTVDSSEMAFKIAGSMGFKKGAAQASPVLLEPIMRLEVVAPDDCLGDVIGDLNSKRGRVLGVEPGINSQTIKAQVPMAEVLTYASALRSITGGRGGFTMEFSHYEEVPPHLAEKIVAEAAKNKEKE